MKRFALLSALTALAACESADLPTEPWGGPLMNAATMVEEIRVVELEADTYVRQGTKNRNHGSLDFVRVKQGGKNRILIRADSDGLADALHGAELISARLEFTILDAGNNWGPSGRTISVHAMTRAWTELGATWNCANDTDTSNSHPDCDADAWDMKDPAAHPWEPEATATALITKRQTGTVSFDVTADVAALAAGDATLLGWIVKKSIERQAGRVDFGSRESAVPPRLVLAVDPRVVWTSVVAGDGFSCAIAEDRNGYCWGTGVAGEFDPNGGTVASKPSLLQGGLLWTVISGQGQRCGLTLDGMPYCWGDNLRGRLGIGHTTKIQVAVPTPVVGGLTFTSIHSLHDTGCGVTPNGEAYCWGGNWAGQLGRGFVSTHAVGFGTPGPVVVGIVFDGPVQQGLSFGCGLSADGNVYCWGDNRGGQLGDGSAPGFRGSPASVPLPDGTVQVVVGGDHTCALDGEGQLRCWGHNDFGQLGDGTTTDRPLPVAVAQPAPFVSFDLGHDHTCGTTAGGVTYCWGDNSRGQLGDGTFTSHTLPTPTELALRFTALSGGRFHTCALDGRGRAYCWGANDNAQLGDGTTTDRNRPTRVLEPGDEP